MLENKHEYYMKAALKLAQQAFDEGEIPVGAIVVCQDKIIGKGYNQTEKLTDVTAHAEMLAITAAQNYLGSKFLEECTLYVSLEPCVMCAGAIFWARPSMVIYGADDEKRGFTKTNPNIFHPKTQTQKGILANEGAKLMKDFFSRLRNN